MKSEQTQKLSCDFCGKNQDNVAKLITAPDSDTAICNNCVAACADIILDAIKTSSFVQPINKGGAA